MTARDDPLMPQWEDRREAPLDPIVRCTVCGAGLLVDARDVAARLHHYGDGSHRLIPAPNPPAAVFLEVGDARLHVLALAIRLRDIADDLDALLDG